MQYENESTKIMEENLGEVPEYEVEEILSVRISEKTNEPEYYIKWLGYSDSENTWEPENNLNCDELLEEYKKKNRPKMNVDEIEPGNDCPNQILSSEREKNETKNFQERPVTIDVIEKDFASNLVPELILGAIRLKEKLYFIIKWQDLDEADIVPASKANVQWPKLVIRYYEERFIID